MIEISLEDITEIIEKINKQKWYGGIVNNNSGFFEVTRLAAEDIPQTFKIQTTNSVNVCDTNAEAVEHQTGIANSDSSQFHEFTVSQDKRKNPCWSQMVKKHHFPSNNNVYPHDFRLLDFGPSFGNSSYTTEDNFDHFTVSEDKRKNPCWSQMIKSNRFPSNNNACPHGSQLQHLSPISGNCSNRTQDFGNVGDFEGPSNSNLRLMRITVKNPFEPQRSHNSTVNQKRLDDCRTTDRRCSSVSDYESRISENRKCKHEKYSRRNCSDCLCSDSSSSARSSQKSDYGDSANYGERHGKGVSSKKYEDNEKYVTGRSLSREDTNCRNSHSKNKRQTEEGSNEDSETDEYDNSTHKILRKRKNDTVNDSKNQSSTDNSKKIKYIPPHFLDPGAMPRLSSTESNQSFENNSYRPKKKEVTDVNFSHEVEITNCDDVDETDSVDKSNSVE